MHLNVGALSGTPTLNKSTYRKFRIQAPSKSNHVHSVVSKDFLKDVVATVLTPSCSSLSSLNPNSSTKNINNLADNVALKQMLDLIVFFLKRKFFNIHIFE